MSREDTLNEAFRLSSSYDPNHVTMIHFYTETELLKFVQDQINIDVNRFNLPELTIVKGWTNENDI